MRLYVLHFVFVLSTVSWIGAYSSKKPAADLDVTPRVTVAYEDLLDGKRFSSRALNYSTLLLEDEKEILYVGARGAIYALNSSDIADDSQKTIHWEASAERQKDCQQKGRNNKTECFNHIRLLQRFNETHLYVCGTHAFYPLCTHIDVSTFRLPSLFEEGKEKCPYDPAVGYTGLVVDGGLYTATGYEFKRFPGIRRNMNQRVLKTDDTPPHSLNDADFVASVLIRESANTAVGDDDKIYYFFNERAGEESSSFVDKTMAARVARVCKSDLGGKKLLQRKWTTFLKANLLCSIRHYEVLKSVCTLDTGTWNSTTFYAAFTLQWRNMEASAVCQYSFSEVQKAFEGPYMEYQKTFRKWSLYEKDIPRPRPGSCITNTFREQGYNSSLDLPDAVLTFVKTHPLMYNEVKPTGDLPILMKNNVVYTRIVVDRVTALDGQQYDVLFIGTGDGWIHRTVVIGSSVHIIEEIQAFKDPQPVENLVISKTQRSLYIGAQSGVLQLALSTCRRYTTCYDCILARDPYCGWGGESCEEIATSRDRAHMTQDVQYGRDGCPNSTTETFPAHKNRTVLKGDDVLLQCDLNSNLAKAQWVVNETASLEDFVGRFRVGVDGLLITDTLPEHSGDYSCYAEENSLRSLVAVYSLNVLLELPKEKVEVVEPTAPVALPTAAPQADQKMEFVYISVITILGGLCFVLSIVLLYVSCQKNRKGKYGMVKSRNSNVELQTVSSNFKEKSSADDMNNYNDGCLQIIPGEAPTTSPNKDTPPPPPPPPPLPSEFTNGMPTLPSMLRKMNGNSYMLLRQHEEPASHLYSSFTEELSKILEKRKHTQLVEKLDESSV